MAMVGVVSGSLYSWTHSLSRLVWSFGAILHSSNEPGELSQWLCHDDSTINIVVVIIIIIIIIYLHPIAAHLLKCLPPFGDRNFDDIRVYTKHGQSTL